jgi:phage repressor protein C with HTH and peptisase S24 domain
MLSHAQVWTALDRLAERYGMTASGLARKAGLDATSFNKSKRVSPDGRQRWPSTESISKVLNATGASLREFMSLADTDPSAGLMTIPLVGWAQAGAGKLFTPDGMPAGPGGWEEVEFPDFSRDKVFAIEVSGDSMQPLYREGDVLIVSPTATLRKGDRVVLRLANGEVMAKELKRRTARTVELSSLNKEHEDRTVPMSDVSWIARVLWARQ